eukprot:gene15876-11363_t
MYGGKDCSWTIDDQGVVKEILDQICTSIVYVGNASNPSAQELDALLSSLLLVSEGLTLTDYRSSGNCQQALQVVATMAADGYLVNAAYTAAQQLVTALVNFVTPGESLYTNDVLSLVVRGLLAATANGESPRSVTSDGLQLEVRRDLVSTFAEAELTFPQSDKEVAYSRPATRLQLVNQAGQYCSDSDGFVQMVTSKWTVVPFVTPNQTVSSTVRTEVYANPTSVDDYPSVNRSRAMYYYSIPFSSTQELRHWTLEERLLHPHANLTMPQCGSFNADSATFDDCGACEVSTFDNDTVTFLVLMQNPFAVDWASAKAIVSFVGIIVLVWMAGLAVFYQWDTFDYYVHTYASLAKKPQRRRGKYGTLQRQKTISAALSTAYRQAMDQASHAASATFMRIASFADTAMERSGVGAGDDRSDLRTMQGYAQADPRLQAHPLVASSVAPSRTPTQLAYNLPWTASIVDSDEDDSDERRQQKAEWYAHAFQNVRNAGLRDIKTLLNTALPMTARVWRYHGLQGVFEMIAKRHPLSAMFTATIDGRLSRQHSRVLLWMNLASKIALLLFFDTLFFGIFFADQGFCETLVTKDDCLQSVNTASGLSTCLWADQPAVYRPMAVNVSQDISPTTYFTHIHIEEEAQLLLYKLKQYVERYLHDKLLLATTGHHQQVYQSSSALETLEFKAMERVLGLRIDGSVTSSTLTERFVYRDHQYAHRVQRLLRRTRQLMQSVNDTIETLPLVNTEPLRSQSSGASKDYPPHYYIQFLLLRRSQQGSARSKDRQTMKVFLLQQEYQLKQRIQFYRQEESRNVALIRFFALVLAEVVKVVVLQFVAMYAIEPQLLSVYRVLYRKAADALEQDLATDSNPAHPVKPMTTSPSSAPQKQRTVPMEPKVASPTQHYHQYVPLLLTQHLSPVCRAAHSRRLYDLPVARLLRTMSGADMEMCKVMEHKPLHWMVMYFVAVPVLLGFFGREIASAILTATLPTSSYMFVLANYYLVQVSAFTLVGVYLGLMVVYWYQHRVAKPAM